MVLKRRPEVDALDKNNRLLGGVLDTLQTIKSEINKMNDLILYYFGRISKEEYSKCHISINNKIIYNTVFKSNIVRKFLRKTNITIVDIGAGCCDLAEKLLNAFHREQDVTMIAVDISSNMFKNSKIIPKKCPFNIRFVLADATSTGLKSDCSDITFVINVLPYIEDVKALLCELYRITHNDGIVVIVKPVKDRFNFWERSFEEIKIQFHDNFENIVDLKRFQIIENNTIDLNPIQDVKIIKIEIGKLMILKVLK